MPEFIYKDATSEQKDAARAAYGHLLQFKEFQNKASLPLFQYLFKERGEHLFAEVFVRRSNRNLIHFFNEVDIDVFDIIIMNILHNDTLYSHKFLYE